jgi:hypothetical protein
VARNNLRQRSIYESAHLISKMLEISTSDRICIAAVKEFLSNSMQIFFFMKEKNIDCGVRTADIS